MGGAFHPDVSPDGTDLILSSYYSGGFKISRIKFSREIQLYRYSPQITPYWKEPQPAGQDKTLKQPPDVNNDFPSSNISSQLKTEKNNQQAEKNHTRPSKPFYPDSGSPHSMETIKALLQVFSRQDRMLSVTIHLRLKLTADYRAVKDITTSPISTTMHTPNFQLTDIQSLSCTQV